MSDPTVPSPPTGSADADASAALDEARAEIDRIDDAIQDLLVRRSEMVDIIRAAKAGSGGSILRPGREASVLRRLMQRSRGVFPRPVIVRIWREIFSALVALQDRLTLAVWMPERGAGYLEVARNQYGSLTAASVHQTPAQVVQEIVDDRATVGVLPLPQSEADFAWWTNLLSNQADSPRVVARLPFQPGRDDLPEALAVAKVKPEASDGPDNTLLVLECSADISRASLMGALSKADITAVGVMDSRSLDEDTRLHLIEIDGFVDGQDVRLKDLEQGSDGRIAHAVVIGAYAVPLSAADMAPPAGG
ncbi:MAG: chorismate mutase, partial [Rhodospirillaceae bacterium]